MSAPTQNEECKLLDGSYSVSDILDYFENILREDGRKTGNPSIGINVNKIENRITFKITRGYHLKLLMPKTMKLLGGTKNKIIKDGNNESVPHLEITEVVLVHYNTTNNGYKQD